MTNRTTARIVGGLFLLATAAGVLSVVFLQSVVDATDYLATASVDVTRVATGALLELAMYVAILAIAIVIYPILKQFSERLAVGYVVARTIEVMTFLISTMGVLTLVTMSRGFGSAGSPDASHLQALGDTLWAGGGWGNAVLAGTAFGLSALILNYALYRTRLVPRWLSGWGLVGAALYLAAGVAVLHGLEPFSATRNVFNLPPAVQEMVFAVWLIVKGFDARALASEPETEPAAVGV